ncbi:MAG: hypothetical protein OHK0022_03810 [Roseiflexaceae bacterium]
MINQPIRITHPMIAAIGIVSILFFSFMAALSWRNGEGNIALVFLLFVALGLYVWLTAGETEMNSLHIRRRAYLGTYAMRWDEVTVVEFDPDGQGILLRGDQKKLAIPGIIYWPGAQREAGLRFLHEQAERQGIPVRDNPWAGFHRSKNTREPF